MGSSIWNMGLREQSFYKWFGLHGCVKTDEKLNIVEYKCRSESSEPRYLNLHFHIKYEFEVKAQQSIVQSLIKM